MTLVYALLAGLGCGIVFALAKLPVPAPPTAAGIAGIVGITLGWWIVRSLA